MMNQPGPASSEGDHSLSKFLYLSDRGSKHAVCQVFFKREEITSQKSLTLRLGKMFKILQPCKIRILKNCCQTCNLCRMQPEEIGSMAHGLKMGLITIYSLEKKQYRMFQIWQSHFGAGTLSFDLFDLEMKSRKNV